jgi:hypothetical protein
MYAWIDGMPFNREIVPTSSAGIVRLLRGRGATFRRGQCGSQSRGATAKPKKSVLELSATL